MTCWAAKRCIPQLAQQLRHSYLMRRRLRYLVQWMLVTIAAMFAAAVAVTFGVAR